MKHIILFLFFTILSFGLFAQDYQNMPDREWWNSLDPAWKTIIQKQYLKGKNIDPTDEQLASIVTVKQIDCLNSKEINSLKPLAKFRNLEILNCNSTGIESLEGVENLPLLIELYCYDNDNINSLKPLEELVNLTRIHCGNTMVKDLKPLQKLSNLKVLDLHYCVVSDLIYLQDLRSLEELNVAENASLFKLDGIENLNNLAKLNISRTKISSLEPLKDLKRLEMLNISSTPIKSLRPLSSRYYRENLRKLSFSNTKISGRSLDYLVNHFTLENLKGKGNRICPKEIDEFKKALLLVNPNCKIFLGPSRNQQFLNDKCN